MEERGQDAGVTPDDDAFPGGICMLHGLNEGGEVLLFLSITDNPPVGAAENQILGGCLRGSTAGYSRNVTPPARPRRSFYDQVGQVRRCVAERRVLRVVALMGRDFSRIFMKEMHSPSSDATCARECRNEKSSSSADRAWACNRGTDSHHLGHKIPRRVRRYGWWA